MIFSNIKRIKGQEDFKGLKIGKKVKIEGNIELFTGMTTILDKHYGITIFRDKLGIHERNTNFLTNLPGSGYSSITRLLSDNSEDYQRYKSILEGQVK